VGACTETSRAMSAVLLALLPTAHEEGRKQLFAAAPEGVLGGGGALIDLGSSGGGSSGPTDAAAAEPAWQACTVLIKTDDASTDCTRLWGNYWCRDTSCPGEIPAAPFEVNGQACIPCASTQTDASVPGGSVCPSGTCKTYTQNGEVKSHIACTSSDLAQCTSTCGFDIVGTFPAFTNPFGKFVPQTSVTTPARGVVADQQPSCFTTDEADTSKTFFPWSAEKQGCYFNGPYSTSQFCQGGAFSKFWTPASTQAEYQSNHAVFLKHQWLTTRKTVTLTFSDLGIDKALGNGQDTLDVAISVGHGVLDGKCGDVALVRSRSVTSATSDFKYVVNLQIDIRSWSFEISAAQYLPGYNTTLGGCAGGACCKTDATNGYQVSQATPDIIMLPDTEEGPAFTRIANALSKLPDP